MYSPSKDSRKTISTRETGGLGNLVLLINPAIEAMRFANLINLLQDNCYEYHPSTLPRLAILTSETDVATNFLFPLGRSFSILFESHGKLNRYKCTKKGKIETSINENSADRIAIGHFEPYQTHKLTKLSTKSLYKSDHDTSSLISRWQSNIFDGQMDFSDTRLTHLNITDPHNPYLNILVDNSLITSHNDIWGDNLVSFISELITISSSIYPEYTKPASLLRDSDAVDNEF